jgi:hypothetical protein
MSFRCQRCNKAQPQGTATIKVVTQKRAATYQSRVNEKGEVFDPGGEGWEIVKEINLCADCKDAMDKAEQTQKAAVALKMKHNVRQ